MSQKSILSFLKEDTGVSTVFGALLLLAVLTVFLSAFLAIAVPAYKMSEESKKDDRLLSDIFILMESPPQKKIQKTFHTEDVVLRADENSGGFLFAAFVSVPPDTSSFLRYDGKSQNSKIFDELQSPPHLSSLPPDSEYYILSRGSLFFSCRYSQIPERSYLLEDASLLLLQKSGHVFLTPPNISIRKSNDRILLSMSGDIILSGSSPVFANRTVVKSETLQKAEIHDFVSFLAIQYLPPNTDSFLSAKEKEQKTEAVSRYFSDLNHTIHLNFPELISEWDEENSTLLISSESAFELDCTVREIRYSFS
ncbi:MAG: hypothetical protein RBQ94_03910 [Methanimicrococcus sp.]|nr:hypothetical protein [Methanimicrococcus sp.]